MVSVIATQGTMLHDVQGCFLTYHALYVGELRDGDIACPLPPRMTDAQEALIEERVTRALERGGADGARADARACSDPSVYPCTRCKGTSGRRTTT